MSPSEYRTYLFDLDGTLLDSIDLIFRCYRHAAEKHLRLTPPDAVWRAGLGTPLREQFRAVSSDPVSIEAMVVSYREYHQLHHDRSIRLYPDVEGVLERLVERGSILGVVTSKLRRGAERGLTRTGLLDYFHTIVAADDVERPKPDPEPVALALARTGTAPEEAVFIGDSPHDIASGRAAGVATAAVLWGPFRRGELVRARPRFLLDSPGDILSLRRGR